MEPAQEWPEFLSASAKIVQLAHTNRPIIVLCVATLWQAASIAPMPLTASPVAMDTQWTL